MYKNHYNLIESPNVFPIWLLCTKVGGNQNPDITKFPFTVICDTMCLCMKLSIPVSEVVSIMDTFIDTFSLPFQKMSPIQIRVL